MTVYIEYAFLQNFLLDGVLIWLALKTLKMPVRWKRVFLSALIGAVFAVVYPLLRLPAFLGGVFKLAVGLLLCMVAFGQMGGKKGRRGYCLYTLMFFVLSFFFGGTIGGIARGISSYGVKILLTPLVFLCLSLFCLSFFRKLYRRSTIYRYVYTCVVRNNAKSATVQGFFDSGNIATKRGVPVCFLSPEIVYDLWGEECVFLGEARGQVCDELCITTMSGEKTIRLYKGSLEIKKEEGIRRIEEVYFAPSANMISREYTMILHSRIFDEGEEV